MLYNFTIFSKSGFVLFSKEFERVEGQPLNYLVKEVLIKQKGDTNFLYTQDNLHVVRWLYDNKNGLIYAVCFNFNCSDYICIQQNTDKCKNRQFIQNNSKHPTWKTFSHSFENNSSINILLPTRLTSSKTTQIS